MEIPPFAAMPDNLRDIVAAAAQPTDSSNIRDFANFDSALRKSCPRWSIFGVGLGAEYGRWLQQALEGVLAENQPNNVTVPG